MDFYFSYMDKSKNTKIIIIHKENETDKAQIIENKKVDPPIIIRTLLRP